MDAITDRPQYVVTVLRDAKPIAIIEVEPEGEGGTTVDVYYPSPEGLNEVVLALKSALGGANFMNWKQNGVLPVPPDFEGETKEGRDTPEDDAPF